MARFEIRAPHPGHPMSMASLGWAAALMCGSAGVAARTCGTCGEAVAGVATFRPVVLRAS